MLLPIRNALRVRRSLGIETRCGNHIVNDYNPSVPNAGDVLVCADLRRSWPEAIPRTSGPSYGYNCHGLTFAARRTQLYNPSDVQHIINEDGYRQIPIEHALPGDVIIYRSRETGDFEHSGIVVKAKDGYLGPLIVSKWGASQEFVHSYNHCPYSDAAAEFYRMPQ